MNINRALVILDYLYAMTESSRIEIENMTTTLYRIVPHSMESKNNESDEWMGRIKAMRSMHQITQNKMNVKMNEMDVKMHEKMNEMDVKMHEKIDAAQEMNEKMNEKIDAAQEMNEKMDVKMHEKIDAAQEMNEKMNEKIDALQEMIEKLLKGTTLACSTTSDDLDGNDYMNS